MREVREKEKSSLSFLARVTEMGEVERGTGLWERSGLGHVKSRFLLDIHVERLSRTLET